MNRHERREQARWFCRTLWGGREGYVSVGVGVGGQRQGRSYSFRRWEANWARWPDDAATLPSDLVRASDEHDIYVGVLLRGEATDGADHALPGSHAWIDLDDEPEGQHADLLWTLLADPDSFAVLSGGIGKRHVYVALEELTAPPTLRDINERLKIALHGDHGHSPNKVLRLPGTYNHKSRAGGGESALVQIEGWA